MTWWLPEEYVRPVDSKASMCHQLILRRLCAKSSFSDECLPPVSFSVESVRTVVLR